jgi:hypothetical protein
VSPEAYEVALNRSARRALAETLPLDVANVMRDWRVLYVIDEERRRVTVRDVRHRRDAYRSP